MRARSACFAALALLALLPACKGDAKTSTLGRVGGSATSGLSNPLADPTASSTTAAGGAVTNASGASATTAGAGGSPTTTAAPGAPGAPGSAATAGAQAALDGYLEGLRSEDYAAAMSRATEGPRLLAFVRHILKKLNEQNGAKSTFVFTQRSYTASATTAERVVFSGRAVLKQTTKLPSGETEAREVTLGEIAAVQRNGVWLVSELVWMGTPVRYWPAQSRATVTPTLDVRLAGAVSFGNSTSTIVVFEAKQGSNIKVEKDRLHSAGADDASRLRALVENYAYFDYPRHDAAPRTWTANITGGSGAAKPITLAFD